MAIWINLLKPALNPAFNKLRVVFMTEQDENQLIAQRREKLKNSRM